MQLLPNQRFGKFGDLERFEQYCQREDLAWTKVTGGIRFWPQFMEDQKSVLDEDDHFTVLREWRKRKFLYVQGRAWAFT